jgi:hypothetical protein
MAINWEMLKQIYLKGSHASQLYSLALNLTRIQALAQSETDGATAKHLVRESQFFIEWTVPTLNLDADITFATELVDLQRLLSQWKLDWEKNWEDEANRLSLIKALQPWCDSLQTRSTHLSAQAS